MFFKFYTPLLTCLFISFVVEPMQRERVLKFYEDKESFSIISGIIDEYADKFFSWSFFNHDQKVLKNYLKKKKSLHDFMKHVRPIITLTGEEATISQNEKLKEGVVIVQPTSHSELLSSWKINNIKTIKAMLNERRKDIQYSVWKKDGDAFREDSTLQSLTEEQEVYGNCVAVARTGNIYVGCSDGSIQVFNPLEKKRICSLKVHDSSIEALAFSANGEVFISKSEDGTMFVWHIADDRPRAMLEKKEHSKSYLYNGTIVRSHAVKNLLSSYWDKDRLYRLPSYWLNPSKFSGDINKLTVLYLLYKAYFNIKFSPESLNVLYNTPALDAFEPPVTYAFKRFIEQKAQDHGIKIHDALLDAR